MTSSIWHKASEKPELNKHVVVRKHGFAQWKVFKFDNKTTFYEPFTDDLWAYVDDLIAQADKAERLQKQLNGQKAFSEALWVVWTQVQQQLEKAKEEIEQLIKVE